MNGSSESISSQIPPGDGEVVFEHDLDWKILKLEVLVRRGGLENLSWKVLKL